MISIIITSFKETGTIGRAIECFLRQKLKDYEILVLAPDDGTLKAARRYSKRNKKIKLIKDSGRGKPSALNAAFQKAKGEILILSDGDVYSGKGSVNLLVKKMEEEKAGAVSGRVIPINNRYEMFGYWAHVLTKGFHNLRMRESRKGKVICSGYLYAVKSGIINKIPEGILADDAYISQKIIESGYASIYEPEAEVYVKYPNNLREWISQKKRTAGRFYQNKSAKTSKIKNFKHELIAALQTLKEIKSLKEAFWFFLLAVMRGYIWFRVFFDFRLWKRDFKKTWQRIESSK